MPKLIYFTNSTYSYNTISEKRYTQWSHCALLCCCRVDFLYQCFLHLSQCLQLFRQHSKLLWFEYGRNSIWNTCDNTEIVGILLCRKRRVWRFYIRNIQLIQNKHVETYCQQNNVSKHLKKRIIGFQYNYIQKPLHTNTENSLLLINQSCYTLKRICVYTCKI